jgi:hypothetical protein
MSGKATYQASEIGSSYRRQFAGAASNREGLPTIGPSLVNCGQDVRNGPFSQPCAQV